MADAVIALNGEVQLEDAAIQTRWRWFRAQVMAHHDMTLPLAFTAQDGQVDVWEWRDDPMLPAEFNYDSRTQTLTFEDSSKTVELVIHRAMTGSYDRYLYRGDGQQVKLLASPHVHRLELSGTADVVANWERAVAELRTSDAVP